MLSSAFTKSFACWSPYQPPATEFTPLLVPPPLHQQTPQPKAPSGVSLRRKGSSTWRDNVRVPSKIRWLEWRLGMVLLTVLQGAQQLLHIMILSPCAIAFTWRHSGIWSSSCLRLSVETISKYVKSGKKTYDWLGPYLGPVEAGTFFSLLMRAAVTWQRLCKKDHPCPKPSVWAHSMIDLQRAPSCFWCGLAPLLTSHHHCLTWAVSGNRVGKSVHSLVPCFVCHNRTDTIMCGNCLSIILLVLRLEADLAIGSRPQIANSYESAFLGQNTFSSLAMIYCQMYDARVQEIVTKSLRRGCAGKPAKLDHGTWSSTGTFDEPNHLNSCPNLLQEANCYMLEQYTYEIWFQTHWKIWVRQFVWWLLPSMDK